MTAPDLKTVLSRLHSTAAVLGGLPELPGYNGSMLKIDDVEAARCVADINAAIALLDAATPTRAEFEAAAYRYIRLHFSRGLLEKEFDFVAPARAPAPCLDEQVAAAMGWPTVPPAPTPKEPT